MKWKIDPTLILVQTKDSVGCFLKSCPTLSEVKYGWCLFMYCLDFSSSSAQYFHRLWNNLNDSRDYSRGLSQEVVGSNPSAFEFVGLRAVYTDYTLHTRNYFIPFCGEGSSREPLNLFLFKKKNHKHEWSIGTTIHYSTIFIVPVA